MKNDRYLKFVLTVIALCLLWICIREIPITPNLYAETSKSLPPMDVNISGADTYALQYAGTLDVHVENAAEIAEQIIKLLPKE